MNDEIRSVSDAIAIIEETLEKNYLNNHAIKSYELELVERALHIVKNNTR